MAGRFVWLRTSQGEAEGVQGVARDQEAGVDPDDPGLAVAPEAGLEVALAKDGPPPEVAAGVSLEVRVDPGQDPLLGAGPSPDPNPGTGPNPNQDPNQGTSPNLSLDPNLDPNQGTSPNQGPSPNLLLKVDHHPHQGPSPDLSPSPQQWRSQWKESRIDHQYELITIVTV